MLCRELSPRSEITTSRCLSEEQSLAELYLKFFQKTEFFDEISPDIKKYLVQAFNKMQKRQALACLLHEHVVPYTYPAPASERRVWKV